MKELAAILRDAAQVAAPQDEVFDAEREHSLPIATTNPQTHVAVIGAGPAGLMAAEVLAQGGAGVTVYDAMPSAGRKFLMAGRGGLNLTHSEALPEFLTRYREAMPKLAPAIEAFPPDRPAAMERGTGPADLRRFQRPGFSRGVQGLAAAAGMAAAAGFDGRAIRRCGIAGPAGTTAAACRLKRRTDSVATDTGATVLALGGASWPRLGSDGAWVEWLAAKGVTISPLRSANCGFTVAWSDIFRDRFEGQPLKGIALSFGSHRRARRGAHHAHRHRGRRGLCALGRLARGHPGRRGRRRSHIALRPDLATERADGAAVGAERQAIALELAAQGGASVAGRHRAVAGGGGGVRRIAVLDVDGRLAGLINAVPVQTEWRRADRARDLDRGRNSLRRTRCGFHDPAFARRVRVRRNAGLGSADRRLPAAGLVRDGGSGGEGRVEVAFASIEGGQSEACPPSTFTICR